VKPIEAEDSKEEEEVVLLEDETEPFDDGNPWFYDIENFYRDGLFLDYATADDRKALRRIASCYKIIGGVLHKKTFSGLFLRCIADVECL